MLNPKNSDVNKQTGSHVGRKTGKTDTLSYHDRATHKIHKGKVHKVHKWAVVVLSDLGVAVACQSLHDDRHGPYHVGALVRPTHSCN